MSEAMNITNIDAPPAGDERTDVAIREATEDCDKSVAFECRLLT
jgi:hypothetical protein